MRNKKGVEWNLITIVLWIVILVLAGFAVFGLAKFLGIFG